MANRVTLAKSLDITTATNNTTAGGVIEVPKHWSHWAVMGLTNGVTVSLSGTMTMHLAVSHDSAFTNALTHRMDASDAINSDEVFYWGANSTLGNILNFSWTSGPFPYVPFMELQIAITGGGNTVDTGTLDAVLLGWPR